MIKEIFCNLNIIKDATLKSAATRKVSDINAIAGGIMELNIIRCFNKTSKTHKLYNLKTIQILLDQGVVFDFGTVSSLKQLKLECKKTLSQFSASDFLLFEESNGTLKLVDSISLKTSIDAHGSPIILHNDAEGEIYDLYSNSLISTGSIGQIVMIVKRGQAIKVYHFDGSLSKLFGSTSKVKSNKHNDITLGLNNNKEVKNNNVLFLTNRNAKTGNKATSFRRGIKIKTSPNKTPFLALEDLVKVGAISKLLEFNITKKEVDEETIKLLGE